MEVNGTWESRFEPVVEVFRENFAKRNEVGACFALFQDGEPRIDIWAGARDRAGEKPWLEDTIVNVYSTTKTMTALSALVLADRGELDVDAPVARYWPEFAQNGKEGVLVRHCMSHTAGLPGLDEPVSGEDLYDWDKITGLLAAQAPWWEPGTKIGYHALTQGYLVGEVVRRITGQTLGQFFRREIAEPLEADFHIGLDARHDARVAELIPPPAPPADGPVPDPESIAARTFRSPVVNAKAARTREWRAAEIPAANGHGNARSVARVQAVLACGGEAFGKRLLSEQGARRALEEQFNGDDEVLGVPLRHGLGYGLNNPDLPLGPNENMVYWGGWGGSTIIVDFDQRLSLSYVMNRMDPSAVGDPRGFLLTQAVYRSLEAG